jgi:hypothetical protein
MQIFDLIYYLMETSDHAIVPWPPNVSSWVWQVAEEYTSRSARLKHGVCSVLIQSSIPMCASLSYNLGYFVLMFDGEKLLNPHVPPPHFWARRLLIGTERKRTSSSASASRQPIPARTCLSFQGLSAWWRDPQVRISTVNFVAPHEAARLTRWARLRAEFALKDL